jgi:hypothetical protein
MFAQHMDQTIQPSTWTKLHFLSFFCLVLIFVHMLFCGYYSWMEPVLYSLMEPNEYGHCKTSGTIMGAGVGGLVAPQGHEQIQMNWRWRARKKIHGVLPRVHLRHSSGPRFFYFRFVHRHVFLDGFQIKVQKKCSHICAWCESDSDLMFIEMKCKNCEGKVLV